MKKILLASTMLVGTAGFAAADVTLSGAAGAGVVYDFTAKTITPETWANFTAGMMTTTDGGLEAGATFTVSSRGSNIVKSVTSDYFGFQGLGGVNVAASASVSDASVYLSGSWGKVTIAYDNDNDDIGAGVAGTDYDVTATYTNTWGAFGLALYTTIAGPAATNVTTGDSGIDASYSFGNYKLGAFADYDMSAKNATVGAYVEASLSGFTGSVKADYDLSASWGVTVKAGYATGPYSINALVDYDAASTTTLYSIAAGYDLGGGVSLNAGYAKGAATSIVYAGVGMKF